MNRIDVLNGNNEMFIISTIEGAAAYNSILFIQHMIWIQKHYKILQVQFFVSKF